METCLERTWVPSAPAGPEHRTIAALATGAPGAAALLRSLGIGACGGGSDRTLAAAAAAHGLALGAIVREIEARAEAPLRLAPDGTEALIEFIVARYHQRHRAELPGLIALAAEVEHAAVGREDAPAGLAELLDALRAGLEEHMLKEEMRVFPLMRAGRGDLLAGPLALMRGEHENLAQFLLRSERLTRGYRPPADAPPARRRLCAEVAGFVDDLVAHVHIEERRLFPRFHQDAGLAP